MQQAQDVIKIIKHFKKGNFYTRDSTKVYNEIYISMFINDNPLQR